MQKTDQMGIWVEAGKTKDTIVVAQAKDDSGLEQGSSNEDREEQKTDLKYILEVEVAELTTTLGDGDTEGEGSKTILRGLVFVIMWIRVLLCEIEKTRFGKTGKQKFCQVWDI